jgi:hypothetical protein
MASDLLEDVQIIVLHSVVFLKQVYYVILDESIELFVKHFY